MSINSCCFSGNATREPETKVSSVGSIYVTFGLAVNNRVFDAAKNDFVDTVVYVDFIAFGANADYVKEHVHRGTKVFVEAKLEQSMYRDREGKIKRWTSYRVVNIDAREDTKPKWTSPEWI
jgi:single-strand DNA-binding protein